LNAWEKIENVFAKIELVQKQLMLPYYVQRKNKIDGYTVEKLLPTLQLVALTLEKKVLESEFLSPVAGQDKHRHIDPIDLATFEKSWHFLRHKENKTTAVY